MVARFGIAWLTLASTLLVSVTARAQCTKDTECKGDRVCEAGNCVMPAAPEPQATPDPSPSPPPAAAAAPAAAPPSVTYLVPAPVAAEPAPAPAPEVPQTQRNSVAMMATGITLISLAPIGLLVAAVAAGQKSSCNNNPAEYYYDPLTGEPEVRVRVCDNYDPTIYGFTIGGIALFAVGIPLFIVGSRRVPVEGKAAAASVSPWVSKDGGGATLRLEL